MSEAKIKVGRIELKLQTDGYYSGNPSVFVEVFGCNLSCPKLNSKHVPSETPKHYETVGDISTGLIHTGCDHAHAWHKDYYWLNSTQTVTQICERILDVLPDRSWVALSGKPIHLIFTGGEPLLQQAMLAKILNRMDRLTGIAKQKPLSYVTIETNATQELTAETITAFKDWERNNKYIEEFSRQILFANSPKLSNTGESVYNITSSNAIFSQMASRFKTTFKFTIPPEEKYADEIKTYFEEMDNFWRGNDLDPLVYDDLSYRLRKALVYVTNEGSNRSQVDFGDLRKLAKLCLEQGYICRLRSHLFWGE